MMGCIEEHGFITAVFLLLTFLSGNKAVEYNICNVPSITISSGEMVNLTSPDYGTSTSYRETVDNSFECVTNIVTAEGGYIAVQMLDVDLAGPKNSPDLLRVKRTLDNKNMASIEAYKHHIKAVIVKSNDITVKFIANAKSGGPDTPGPVVSDLDGPSSYDDGGGSDTFSISYNGYVSYASYSYSDYGRRRRRRDTSGPRGFKLQISWLSATADLACNSEYFSCRKEISAITCLDIEHQCDNTYTCPDRSDEFDCDICANTDVAPANGTVAPNEGPFYIGQVLQFKCNEGFERIGVKETQCTLDRKWKDPVPACIWPPESTVDPRIAAREKRETTIFLATILPSIALCLAIAIGLLQLCTRHLEAQEKIFEAEWEAEQAELAEKAAREAEEQAANEAMENGEIATIKIGMDNGIVADPTEVKIPLEGKCSGNSSTGIV
ncbi:uncharacterized protein [Amphiura filiformis]|uniref:uncharacterized protein n=1 Tax=Amphiura filiformis TaxID=82378 RepID=UPI003B2281F5